MTCAVFDFPTIAKHARLKALDGTPQNVVQPMAVNTAPVEFDPYGMYLTAVSTVEPIQDAPLASLTGGVSHVTFHDSSGYDTAPAEYSPPETDPA